MTRVTPTIYRGPRPTSIVDVAGMKSLLDLETGIYDFFHPWAAVRYLDIALQVGSVTKIRLSNWFSPSRSKLDSCLLAMTVGPFPMYVHCRYGVDRTGVVCAYYRVLAEGWTPDAAIDEMRQLGFHAVYESWIPGLRRAMETKP